MANALTNLIVQCDSSPGPIYTPGWDFYTVDLNTGAGGKYIYVGYQKGSGDPITSVNFVAYDHAESHSMPGWEWSNKDLNMGAGGKYIYMYWKKGEAGKAPITSLLFLVLEDSTEPKIPGWTGINQDLNQGAGGPYIWPYYSTTIPSGLNKVKTDKV